LMRRVAKPRCFFWGGAFTTGQAAQRAPPQNHGPASRRPRPSAESAPLPQPLYCMSTRPTSPPYPAPQLLSPPSPPPSPDPLACDLQLASPSPCPLHGAPSNRGSLCDRPFWHFIAAQQQRVRSQKRPNRTALTTAGALGKLEIKVVNRRYRPIRLCPLDAVERPRVLWG
jgi:hypothetical protein